MRINHDPGAVRVQVKHHGMIFANSESIEFVQPPSPSQLISRVLLDYLIVDKFLKAELMAGALEKLPRDMDHHLIVVDLLFSQIRQSC